MYAGGNHRWVPLSNRTMPNHPTDNEFSATLPVTIDDNIRKKKTLNFYQPHHHARGSSVSADLVTVYKTPMK